MGALGQGILQRRPEGLHARKTRLTHYDSGMLFAYVDETGDTGDTGKRGSSACYSLGCLLISADSWIEATGAMVEYRRKLKRLYGIPVRAELKANILIRNSGRLRDLGIEPRVRKQIFRDHLRTVHSFDGEAFAVVVDKERRPDDDWAALAWDTLLQRLERRATKASPRETVMLIHDNGENLAVRKIARKARVRLTAGSAYGHGRFVHQLPLIEDPIPRDSESSYLLQLADMIAYAGWRTYMRPSRSVAGVVPGSSWNALGDSILTKVNSVKLNGSVPGVVLMK